MIYLIYAVFTARIKRKKIGQKTFCFVYYEPIFVVKLLNMSGMGVSNRNNKKCGGSCETKKEELSNLLCFRPVFLARYREPL